MVSTKQEGVSVTSSSIENGQSDDVLDGSILTYLETESMQTKVFQKHDVCKILSANCFCFCAIILIQIISRNVLGV